MRNFLRYGWQLSRLKRARKKAIHAEMEVWNKLSPEERADRFETIGRANIEPFEEDIDDLLSDRLCSQAQKYGIPESHFEFYWSKHRHHYLLMPSSRETLRLAIHEERKRRGEIVRLWLPAIAAVISAFVALAAVILGKR